MNNNKYIAWISVDPIRHILNVYPKTIAMEIENSYQNRSNCIDAECVLGYKFFNATIYFDQTGNFCQTTPGNSIGRGIYKPSGNRSVRRICVEDKSCPVIIYGKINNNECRIVDSEYNSDIKFQEYIPSEKWLEMSSITSNIVESTIWNPDDLIGNEDDKEVIVWEWCRGIPEKLGDLTKISDNWWVPYNYENTNIIETAFKNNQNYINTTEIELPLIGKRIIEFKNTSCYAKQVSLDRGKVRFVRRIIKTVSALKTRFANISNPILDIDTIIAGLPDGTVPHHFYCPILQDVMKYPVKTIDNHIYDREAILTWFTYKDTSPLTGLQLSSKIITPYSSLKNEIEQFFANLNHNSSLLQQQ